MSIGPIQIILPVAEDQPVRGGRQTQLSTGDPAAEPSPKPETSANQDTAASASAPQEEVKVQRDMATGEHVYQFIDGKSGSVILQIPTEQILDFIREIQQQQARLASGRKLQYYRGKGELWGYRLIRRLY